ncbi:hypothetical protein ACLOJK_012394 [Asimina triloba]
MSRTAVVVNGDEEVHLVAMPSRPDEIPGFWCCAVPGGLYDSCKGMLNLRCLAIVFDLDETLIVANTMKSFEDRIEFLQRRIAGESDGLRSLGMKAELRRYLDDKALLKQYSENDHVSDNGKIINIQLEEVPPIANNQEQVIRPIIRLQDKNVILTRINPEVRDTSVLVRLRPAWEELRSYLTAKGRKRFEVYVCTMAERDYALEMWRLLDPEANLISSKQLLERVICVKSGTKSLLNVFQDGICHPKMAMVIDDRLKVWDDKDQPRVHVVPPYSPYYAPQAEITNNVPVMCIARNVACNVRGGFFKDFDEKLLRRISEICYEDEVLELPPAPDVGNYLMAEDTAVIPNGIPIPEGISGAEVERRMNRPDQRLGVESGSSHILNNPDLRAEFSQQPLVVPPNFITPSASRSTIPSQSMDFILWALISASFHYLMVAGFGVGPGLLGASPKEAEASQAELDPVTRRRLLPLHHGSDFQGGSSVDPSFRSRPPLRISPPPVQRNGIMQESDASQSDKHRALHNPPNHGSDTSVLTDKPSSTSLVKAEEFLPEDDEVSLHRSSINNGDLHIEAGMVEFKSVISTSKDLQFSSEVLFTGEKIGVGMGRTRKEAQFQAAKNALQNLAKVAYRSNGHEVYLAGEEFPELSKSRNYVAHLAPESEAADMVLDKPSSRDENGFLMDIPTSASAELHVREEPPNANMFEEMGTEDESKRLTVLLAGIKDLVEIAGEVLGKAVGSSRDGATLQAAAAALGSLKSMVNQQASKRSSSPRSAPTIPNKRSKDEVLQGLQVVPTEPIKESSHFPFGFWFSAQDCTSWVSGYGRTADYVGAALVGSVKFSPWVTY